MDETIREKLLAQSDAKYREFSSALVPGTTGRMIGVRLPALRNLAKEIVKGDWRSFLNEHPCEYYEETMLKGMVIGCAKTEPEELLRLIEFFIPQIENWGVCDSFCAGLRINAKNKRQVWDLMQVCFKSDEEYEVRFAVVMLLMHYINNEYIEKDLKLLDLADHPGYYAGMAVAWGSFGLLCEIPGRNRTISPEFRSLGFCVQ